MTTLETLVIPHAHTKLPAPIRDAIKGHSFPSIKTLVLPPQAHHIARSCPNVTSISVGDHQEFNQLLCSAMAQFCPKLEELLNICASSDKGLDSKLSHQIILPCIVIDSYTLP